MKQPLSQKSIANLLYDALKELVHQHETGYWSTWQTTAHFQKPLDDAADAIKAYEATYCGDIHP